MTRTDLGRREQAAAVALDAAGNVLLLGTQSAANGFGSTSVVARYLGAHEPAPVPEPVPEKEEERGEGG